MGGNSDIDESLQVIDLPKAQQDTLTHSAWTGELARTSYSSIIQFSGNTRCPLLAGTQDRGRSNHLESACYRLR